jgi:hypothetical protein
MTALSPITGAPGKFLFEQTVLGRHRARYYLDETIQYIFVENPSWLDEAYSSAIAITDTGIFARNMQKMEQVSSLLSRGIINFHRGVDIGGGYGLFVRGMRDNGYEFFWQDLYAENLVARGFEAEPGQYEVAVAFEVLEHIENPASFLAEMKNTYEFETCFFSATCFKEDTVPAADWWYWAFETGQHISFFSRSALEAIADRIGMRVYYLGADLYVFSVHDWSRVRLKKRGLARLFQRTEHPTSLTSDDHRKMVERLRQGIDRS